LDIDILDRIDPDAEISGLNLSNSCSNSDDGQASGTVSGNNVGNGGCSGGYNDEDDDKDWAPWDENNHDFYTTPFHASPSCKPP
jgi:hypothetical protein